MKKEDIISDLNMIVDCLHNPGVLDQIEERLELIITALEKDLDSD